MLSQNSSIKQTFINNIYNKQIFKIMYTAVFCCELAYQQATQSISEEIMKSLVNSIFQFSPYPLHQQKHRSHLEYGQVTFNLKDFLSDLAINLATVELNLVHELIKLIDHAFIEKILTHFNALRQNQLYEQYCEGAIYILINILRLLQTFKLCIHTQHGQKDKMNQYQVERLLCESAVLISSKLNKFIEYFLQEKNKSLNFSSGERIESIGLLKYSVLELIQKVLSINQIQSLSIKFETFDFFVVVQVFLQRYRWNNILHNLIFKITQHILSQDYPHFKKRYLQQVQNYNKSLFGNLIMHFRNRKFIFLHSMHMIGQGHQNFIFRISKILINEMQQKNDLNGLIESFKIWKHFIQVDLKEYEIKNYQFSHCFNIKTEEKADQKADQKANVKYNSLNTPDIHFHSNKPLQTIQQILKHFNQQQKWSPKHSPSQIRKSQLLNNQIIQKMDSLAFYQPLKQ